MEKVYLNLSSIGELKMSPKKIKPADQTAGF
jgi:hypothetical protein